MTRNPPLPPPPRLVCPRRELPAQEVAARAEEPFWQALAPVVLVEAVHGAPPLQATRVRSAWDAHEWRVLFDADDRLPWATLAGRDGPLWTEEAVEVFIDPVGDGQSYFEIEINPLGAVCDLVLRRIASGWRKNFAWQVENLRGAARRRADGGGWSAELSIPFAALGSAAADPEKMAAAGAEWRVNFLRIDRPGGTPDSPAELSAWSPTGERNFHRPERFGRMTFARETLFSPP